IWQIGKSIPCQTPDHLAPQIAPNRKNPSVSAALRPHQSSKYGTWAWLAARGDTPGALFCRLDRGGHLTYGPDGRLQPIDTKTVARLVKRVIAGTGLAVDEFSAHSLRAGMMTAADRKGITLEDAMRHGRWKDAHTARGYRRHSGLWQGNFTGKLLADE
ncbi:MAG: hypothetical protein ACRC67_05550, partial [Inquilinus sp.]|uniref:hypothetical protein n=1 Tax=Inquilinus sp. TaxID=1932117 RepID=UPI003F3BDD09